jgi:phage FluMu gp28-like protein
MIEFDLSKDNADDNADPVLKGEFYIGCDPAKKRDYFVISIVQKSDGKFFLVKKMQFPLGTEYSTVIQWLLKICKKHDRVVRILIDQTGLGDVIVELARKAGLKQATGEVLTMQKKQEILVFFKEQMQMGNIKISFDRELINQLNLEQYEVTETGQTKFNHPTGTHDDQLWSLALAVYAGRPEKVKVNWQVYLSKQPSIRLEKPNLWNPPFQPY